MANGRPARKLTLFGGGLALIAAAVMVGWLVRRQPRSPDTATQRPSAEAPLAGETEPPAEPPPATAEPPAASEGSPQPSAPAIEDPAKTLRDALADADRNAHGMEVLEVKRLLEKVLRRHPELAAVLANAMGDLKNRELLFQLSRVLGRFVRDPAVRAALLEQVREGGALGREAAIYTFVGLADDPEVAGAVADAFEDRDAGARVRAAAAFGLVEMLPALSDDDRAHVRNEAREVAFRPDAPAEVRVEAIDLLDVRGDPGDRDQVRLLLQPDASVPSNVTLAAARVLLTTGEPEGNVIPHLERLAETGLDEASAKSLKAMLEELRTGGN